jgi:hypothetical protein
MNIGGLGMDWGLESVWKALGYFTRCQKIIGGLRKFQEDHCKFWKGLEVIGGSRKV